MWRRLEAGNGSDPRVGDADREDADAAAVLAVRRLELQPGVVALGRQPFAAVANADVSASGELDERCLHLGASGDVERAVHEFRHQGLMLALDADEAVVVVPFVLARAALERRVRLRPADQALVDGEAPEHAAGCWVTRDRCAARDARP